MLNFKPRQGHGTLQSGEKRCAARGAHMHRKDFDGNDRSCCAIVSVACTISSVDGGGPTATGSTRGSVWIPLFRCHHSPPHTTPGGLSHSVCHRPIRRLCAKRACLTGGMAEGHWRIINRQSTSNTTTVPAFYRQKDTLPTTYMLLVCHATCQVS